MKHTNILAAMAGLAITAGSAHAAAVIYEGFEVGDGTLGGNAGGTGTSGNWNSGALTTAGSLSYGSLMTSGGRQVVDTSSFGFTNGTISPGATLTSAGLLNDGAVLWMSVLLDNIDLNGSDSGGRTSNENRTYVGLGAGGSDGFDRVGDGVGGGFTLALNKEFTAGQGHLNVQAWNDGGAGGAGGGATRGALSAANIAPAGAIFAVGKFTWGQFGVTDDLFELYMPGTDLALGSVVGSMTADFDQLGAGIANDAFDTIHFSGGRGINGTPAIDELRFGATYADVAPIPEPSSTALLGLGGLALILRRRK